MEFEKKLIVQKIESLKKEDFSYSLKKQDELINKSLQKSVEARTLGNQLFRKHNHDEKIHEEIWKMYSESIAYAPNDSEELACGYSNRSAFLFHLDKYKECLLDIDRALKITQSCALKVKLFCRQAKCFVAIQDGGRKNSLEKAKYWVNKVISKQEVEKLQKTLQSTVKVVEENIPVTLKEEEKTDISTIPNVVDIRHSEKYGRHLVATRDIKPGEFVCVEKFYATSINKSKRYAYCSNCLGISWATIPCNNCAYYMYCSEDCKNEAWKKYHHIECYARFIKDANINRDHVEISIRSFIMGLKEVGSFEKLKDLVHEIESFPDKRTKGFSKDGKFLSNSFRSLISLYHSNDVKKIGDLALVAILAAMVLTKNSKIFNNVFHFTTDYYKHMEHKDFIFIASLFLRLLSICRMNDFFVTHINRGCLITKSYGQCLRSCCLKGIGLSLLTSLINHSCDNNVDYFCTNDGQIVYYAIKPIKENSQIFTSYCYNYFNAPSKAHRQSFLYDSYDFTCDCLPCQQNWPNGRILAEGIGKEILPVSCHIIIQKYEELLMKNRLDVDIQYSKKFIYAFTKALAKLYKNTTSPSPIFESFRMHLSLLIENRYCSILKIPKSCKSI